MAGFRMRLTGVKQLQRALRKETEIAKRALAAGVYALGNEIMTDSKREVPVDQGVLRGSGYVTLPDIGTKEVSVELGYGGPAKAYAVPQHENLDYVHPEGGKAKYLEDPVNRAQSGALKKVARVAGPMLDSGNAGPMRGTNPTNPDSGG